MQLLDKLFEILTRESEQFVFKKVVSLLNATLWDGKVVLYQIVLFEKRLTQETTYIWQLQENVPSLADNKENWLTIGRFYDKESFMDLLKGLSKAIDLGYNALKDKHEYSR